VREVVGHAGTRPRVDAQHARGDHAEQRRRQAQQRRHAPRRQRGDLGRFDARALQQRKRLGLQRGQALAVAALHQLRAQRAARQRVDGIVQVQQQLAPLQRAQVRVQPQRQAGALEVDPAFAQRRVVLRGELAGRAAVVAAGAEFGDVVRHHAGEQAQRGRGGLRGRRVRQAVLHRDDRRSARQRRGELGRGLGGRAALDRQQHQRGRQARRDALVQRQRGGLDPARRAVEVGQLEPVGAQRVEHTRPADEGDRHAGRVQAAAEVAADRAGAHHEHRGVRRVALGGGARIGHDQGRPGRVTATARSAPHAGSACGRCRFRCS
jgi:hypothetical protein